MNYRLDRLAENPIQEKQIKKPPKYQKNFLFDSDVKFPEFIIFGVKKCGTVKGF